MDAEVLVAPADVARLFDRVSAHGSMLEYLKVLDDRGKKFASMDALIAAVGAVVARTYGRGAASGLSGEDSAARETALDAPLVGNARGLAAWRATPERAVLAWTDRFLTLWARNLARRSLEERKSAAGRVQTALLEQSVRDLAPLQRCLLAKRYKRSCGCWW